MNEEQQLIGEMARRMLDRPLRSPPSLIAAEQGDLPLGLLWTLLDDNGLTTLGVLLKSLRRCRRGTLR